MNPNQTKAFLLKFAHYLMMRFGILPDVFFKQDLKAFLQVYYADIEIKSKTDDLAQVDECGL